MATEKGGEVCARFFALKKMWSRDGRGVCEMACFFVASKNSLEGTLCVDTKKGVCQAHPDMPCCMGKQRGELQLPDGGELRMCVRP